MDDLWKLLLGLVLAFTTIFVVLSLLPSSPVSLPAATTGPPELQGISAYLNSEPFTVSEYIGKKVILIDFWTYTCINCIRTLPYLVSWDEKYAQDGLLIVGVHAPEFEFEKKLENVQAAVDQYGIRYPVVLDNDHATWNAYANRFWPAKYLIDKNGKIIYTHFGEGNYDETEAQIVAALRDLNGRDIAASSVPINTTDVDFFRIGTPELYFGHAFRRAPIGNAPATLSPGAEYNLTLPSTIAPNLIYLEGRWKNERDHMALVSKEGKILLHYHAKVANLVMAGEGDAEVYLDGAEIPVSMYGMDVVNGTVRIGEERLYNLVSGDTYETHVLEIRIHGNARAYAFTFG